MPYKSNLLLKGILEKIYNDKLNRDKKNLIQYCLFLLGEQANNPIQESSDADNDDLSDKQELYLCLTNPWKEVNQKRGAYGFFSTYTSPLQSSEMADTQFRLTILEFLDKKTDVKSTQTDNYETCKATLNNHYKTSASSFAANNEISHAKKGMKHNAHYAAIIGGISLVAGIMGAPIFCAIAGLCCVTMIAYATYNLGKFLALKSNKNKVISRPSSQEIPQVTQDDSSSRLFDVLAKPKANSFKHLVRHISASKHKKNAWLTDNCPGAREGRSLSRYKTVSDEQFNKSGLSLSYGTF